VREAFRINKGLLRVPCDLVVIPRRDWKDVALRDVEENFRGILGEVSKAFAV